MHDKDRLYYKDAVVGHIKTNKNEKIFDWSQTPFKAFSDEYQVYFGMSMGLAEKLKEKNVSRIVVGDWVISLSRVLNSRVITPSHSIFDNPPDQNQYLIRIIR